MKKVIIGVVSLAVVVGVVAGLKVYETNFSKNDVSKACTEEAKICPDGSAVGRTGPNCEFADCPKPKEVIVERLSEAEALAIASSHKECPMTGILSDKLMYNENSKTWWIDLERMPELEKDGCHPACVVSEETKTAEINWRCTGLVAPQSSEDDIQATFAQKYPAYAETVAVSVSQEMGDFARGGVSFAPGEGGGNFLAMKKNGEWQIVFDGNGQIPCSLSQSGFPAEMLKDCAQ